MGFRNQIRTLCTAHQKKSSVEAVAVTYQRAYQGPPGSLLHRARTQLLQLSRGVGWSELLRALQRWFYYVSPVQRVSVGFILRTIPPSNRMWLSVALKVSLQATGHHQFFSEAPPKQQWRGRA